MNTSRETVLRIQESLNLVPAEISERLGMTRKQYDSFIQNHTALAFESLEKLANWLDVDPEAIANGSLDISALQAQFLGNEYAIPERYRVASFSRRRTVFNYLHFLEKKYGWWFRRKLCRHFQIKESAFMDPEAEINILFFQDLVEYLRSQAVPESVIFQVGLDFSKVALGTPLHRELMKERNLGPLKIYEKFFAELIHLQEKNSDYKIEKADQNMLIVSCRAKKDVLDALKMKKIGNTGVCQYKRGVLVVISRLAGFTPTRVLEPKCVHRGDDHCLFVLDFTSSLVTPPSFPFEKLA